MASPQVLNTIIHLRTEQRAHEHQSDGLVLMISVICPEIKFRLWDGHKMQPVGSITFHTDSSYHVNDEFPVNDIEMEERFGGNKYHLMEFTGLKDKKGKEIYEGDYVACGLRMSINGILQKTEGDVVYSEGSGTFCIMTPDKDGGHLGWEIARFCHFEVIGNIYENPHLLK
jgi:uncharacterized phage protein (TIGR01671 family)